MATNSETSSKATTAQASTEAAAQAAAPQTDATTAKKSLWKRSTSVSRFIDTMRSGRGISLDYLRKNAWLLVAIIVAVLSLMGLRYKTKTRMVEIKKLNKELVSAESDKLREKQLYMTLIRQSRMNELVRKNNLGLIHQEQPPYEIDLSDDGEPVIATPAESAPSESAPKENTPTENTSDETSNTENNNGNETEE